jgi:hypothetical protein
VLVVFGGLGDDAVVRGVDLQLPHVRVVSGEEDADVAGDAREDDPPDTERLEERIERRVEESQCFGFRTK